MRHSVEYCPPGVETQGPLKPGDFILTKREGAFLGNLITFGQWIRYGRVTGRYHFWSHAAMAMGAGDLIYESLESGVEINSLSKYKDHHYSVVRIDASDEQRYLMIGFFYDVYSERGGSNRYDYLSVCLLIPIQILTGGKWAFARANTLFCSGAVAEALVKTRTSFFRPAVGMMPCELALVYKVPGPEA